MKRAADVLIIISLLLHLYGCGKAVQAKELADVGGVDFSQGEIISLKDTHGGFHGDGMKLVQVQYQNVTLADALAESAYWRSLPLTENLNTFIYQPYDPELDIPEIVNGYYYFYDRHSGADDPCSDAELFHRHSFNFTLAIFDTDNQVLYFYECDT